MNKSTNHQYGDKVPGAVGARAKRPVPVVVGGDTVLSIRSCTLFFSSFRRRRPRMNESSRVSRFILSCGARRPSFELVWIVVQLRPRARATCHVRSLLLRS